MLKEKKRTSFFLISFFLTNYADLEKFCPRYQMQLMRAERPPAME